MFTTYSAANRIVTSPLTTNFTRELVPVDFTSSAGVLWPFAASYFLYTRIRTKEYEYVGMTKAAAVTCAQAMKALYTRKIPNPDLLRKVQPATGRNVTWELPYPLLNGSFQFVNCADVSIQKESKDDRYKVVISLNEALEFRRACTHSYDETASATHSGDITYYQFGNQWTDFEDDPTMSTGAFRIANASDTTDFDYDET